MSNPKNLYICTAFFESYFLKVGATGNQSGILPKKMPAIKGCFHCYNSVFYHL